ncbi:MAG: hypothetical protein JO043_08840 [Candidatus Eremiobacteraeota bacterium]|nr:hypothetical protein [Candidatus Eremiobacteraeota bacterium]
MNSLAVLCAAEARTNEVWLERCGCGRRRITTVPLTPDADPVISADLIDSEDLCDEKACLPARTKARRR